MARMMLGGLITVLAAALAFHARAADEPAWQFSEWPEFVRYAMHGTVVHGHRFGFIKHRGRCDDDVLSLFWSSFDPRVHRLKGTKYELAMAVDDMSFEIQADLIAAQNLVPRLTVVAFGDFVASEALLDLFGGGKKVAITITGPAAKVFDIASDEFTLAGFAAARRQARAMCERGPA